jgi:hypothetical protein
MTDRAEHGEKSALHTLLCKPKAYRAFRFAAWCMIPLALIFLILLTPIFDTITSNFATRVGFQLISAVVGVLGTVGGMMLFFGMLAYLFCVDRSPWKLLWLIVFLVTAWFGSSIYFFTVYRKQVQAGLRTA